jgi:uncharacterized protein YwgA
MMPVVAERQDWVLRFIAGFVPGHDGWIDRIRIMKGIFLLSKDAVRPPELNYRFVPYDYGPFTPEIYRDIDALLADGFIEPDTYDRAYRVTDAGRVRLDHASFDTSAAARLDELRAEVTDLSFRELLRKVYQEHPESASRSVARNLFPPELRR